MFKTILCRFPGILMKKRHLKNFKKSYSVIAFYNVSMFKTIFCIFPGIFKEKKRHLKNLKKSAYKLRMNKKINKMKKKKNN